MVSSKINLPCAKVLVRWANRPVYFSWFNPPAPNWQHLKSRIDASEQMFSTEPSRSLQGGFCNPPSHPLHRADRYFYHWPLDRWAMTHVATGPAPLSLPPSDAVELGPELLSKEVHEWEARRFYGGETGPCLSSTVTLFQGRYHFSPSHPLKIAATLQRQRQSRQGAARAFIFKCSLWPSKSNNGDILMDALPKIKTRSRVFLTLAWVERQIKRWILNFMHLYSTFHRRQIFGGLQLITHSRQTRAEWQKKPKHPSSTNTRKIMC